MNDKKISICYLADAVSPHTIKLAEYFQKRGHKIMVISFNPGVSGNVSTHYIDSGLFSSFKIKYIVGLPKLKEEIRILNPDILHAVYATSYGFAGACLNFHPYVVSVIGSDVAIRPQDSFIFKWLVQYAIRKADAIHSQSQHLTDRLISLGAKSDKISTFTYGIDIAAGFFLQAREFVGKGGVVISTRALETVYNIDLLIKAIPLVLEKMPNTKLLIVGRGSLEKKLKREVEKLKIGSAVEFIGYLSYENLANVLKKADVYVSTSLSDGQSISLLEGMAMGVFPVVSDIEGNRNWVRNGENGFLCSVFDPEDLAKKIIKALSDPTLRKSAYAINKRIIEKKGSLEKNMALMENQYFHLIKGV
ncbi:MAG: glycosyltransferase family 4 protein [Candidatus Paceibacterota bacterium]